jgi:hypothetical protein
MGLPQARYGGLFLELAKVSKSVGWGRVLGNRQSAHINE